VKKLVAVAALGAVLAAIPVTVAMKRTGVTASLDQALAQQSGPCYKGTALGPCPKAKSKSGR
jgi:hypothetical protein